MKPIQLLKTYEKMCTSVSNFYIKIIINKHTLLYNLPTIHSRQRYYSLCELTTCLNSLSVSFQSLLPPLNQAMKQNFYSALDL